jgi:hypothetical protein
MKPMIALSITLAAVAKALRLVAFPVRDAFPLRHPLRLSSTPDAHYI